MSSKQCGLGDDTAPPQATAGPSYPLGRVPSTSGEKGGFPPGWGPGAGLGPGQGLRQPQR